MPPYLRYILTICASAALTIGLSLNFGSPWLPQSVSDENIRNYLIRHPDAVAEAIQAYMEKGGITDTQSKAALALFHNDIYADGYSIAGANVNGDVTVVEFFDYRCPYCKQLYPELHEALRRDGNIRLLYKELPVLGPDSLLASQFAIAVALHQPDKYAAFHDGLMQTRGALTEEYILQVARESGVDVAALRQDRQDVKIDQAIQANLKLADQLRVTGTPAFVIGDNMINGPIPADRFRELIATARKKG